MFDVGVPELILVLVVALVVFGPGKLPEIGANLGKAIRDFRGATQAITDEVNSVKSEVGAVKAQVGAIQDFNLLAEDEATTKRILAEQEAARQAQSAAPAAEAPQTVAAATETAPVAPAAPLPLRVSEINYQIAELEDAIARQERNRLLMGDASTDGIIATIRARVELLEREAAAILAETAATESTASAAPPVAEPAAA